MRLLNCRTTFQGRILINLHRGARTGTDVASKYVSWRAWNCWGTNKLCRAHGLLSWLDQFTKYQTISQKNETSHTQCESRSIEKTYILWLQLLLHLIYNDAKRWRNRLDSSTLRWVFVFLFYFRLFYEAINMNVTELDQYQSDYVIYL